MKTNFNPTQEDFDALLDWFSADREKAGEIYEKIRAGLIRFFRFRGCSEAETLADETINRVTRKLSTFTFNENVKTTTYFYSFASKIFLEELNRRKNLESLTAAETSVAEQGVLPPDDEEERRFQCLENCLAKLPAEDSRLVVVYYSEEKTEKLELRKRLAESMNVRPATLHTRVHRLRLTLRGCVEKCLAGKNM